MFFFGNGDRFPGLHARVSLEVLPSFKINVIQFFQSKFSPKSRQTFQKSMQFLPKRQSGAQTESSRKGVFSNGRHSSKNAMKKKMFEKCSFTDSSQKSSQMVSRPCQSDFPIIECGVRQTVFGSDLVWSLSFFLVVSSKSSWIILFLKIVCVYYCWGLGRISTSAPRQAEQVNVILRQ